MGLSDSDKATFEKFNLDMKDQMELVEEIATALQVRKGEEITEELAYERARNIACSLINCVIVQS